MKNSLLIAILLSLTACPSSPKTATVEQPGGGPGTVEDPDPEPAPDAGPPPPSYGEDCGRYGICAEGLECLSYYGIAGGNLPPFQTCELRCDAKTTCPEGTTCMTIADGPGSVCRP